MPASIDRWVCGVLAETVEPGSTVIVATSGGPDSQALLHLMAGHMQRLGMARLIAVGVNHGLRLEAASELDYAERLSERCGVEFQRVTVDVRRHGNLLANAREARYAALLRKADELSASHIAVAHTATDQAETVLQHLCRGSSLTGIGGIPKRRGPIIRPLLGVSRQEVLAYLATHAITFATDPSNADERRTRSRLRHSVFPHLYEVNPAFVKNIARSVSYASDDDAFLNELAAGVLANATGPLGSLDAAQLAGHRAPVRRRVLVAWLRNFGIEPNSRDLEQVGLALEKKQATMNLRGQTISLEAERLWLHRRDPYNEALEPFEVTRLPRAETTLTTKICGIEAQVQAARKYDISTIAIDADRLHLALRVRTFRQGDKIAPLGMHGHVKVGDLFTNLKVPRALRPVWPLVTHGEDIIWVVGLRRARHAQITAETRVAIEVTVDSPLLAFSNGNPNGSAAAAGMENFGKTLRNPERMLSNGCTQPSLTERFL